MMESSDRNLLIVAIMAFSLLVLSFVSAREKQVSGAACVLALLGLLVRSSGYDLAGNVMGIIAGVVFAAIAMQVIMRMMRPQP